MSNEEISTNKLDLEQEHQVLQELIENFSQNDLENVLKKGSEFLSLLPNSFKLWNIIGAAHTQLRNFKEALSCYTKAIKLNPNYAEAHNNLGNLFKIQGELEKAITSYYEALEIKPNLYDASYNLGIIYQQKENFNLAKEKYFLTLETKPDHIGAYLNLGILYRQERNFQSSLLNLEKAEELDPFSAEIKNRLGNTLKDQGNYDAAIENFEKAISLDPKFAKAMNNIGNAYMDIGKIDEALTNYKKAIEIDPNFAEAYHNLSKVVKFSSCSSYIDKMCEVYKSGKLMDRDKYHICFALGKAYGDIGEYEEAFSYLRQGNALRKSLLNYDISDDQVLFNQIKDNFKKIKKFPPISSNKKITVTPIFILGMPRSGTTLVEQIISCHSQVYGGGELELCNQKLWPLIKNEQDMSKEILENFRAQYLDAIQGISSGKSFVTDKMPSNFRYIGLIKRALPEAIVIHVKRDPAAVCWSNYKISFSVRGLGYAYDLDDLVKYYQMYDDLMTFWETHYDESLYQLDYERLTNDQVLETKKLINHIGLSWEETCLNPEYNRRSVSTASNQQIRQKIYKGSSNEWKKFEKFLNGKFDKLKN